MVDSNDIFGGVLVLIGLVLVGSVVIGLDIPGTSDGSNDVTQCDINAQVGIEGLTSGAAFNDGTFRFESQESGLFSLTVGRSSASTLSLFTGANNVEVRFTLSGSGLDSAVKDTVDVGDLNALSTETVEFEASRIPEGDYLLVMDMFWDSGSERLQENVAVRCGQ